MVSSVLAEVASSDGATRSFAAHVRDYDWDGDMGPAASDIAALLSSADCYQISAEFWVHYMGGAAARHVASADNESWLERQRIRSARYVEIKYAAPFDDAWYVAATRHADAAYEAGVPLAVLLTSLAYAHARTLALIEARIAGDSARMRRCADVVQRLALIEADVMAAHMARIVEREVAAQRSAQAQAFHEHIAGAIEGAAALGQRVRSQATTAASSASAIIGRGAEVAAASEQSALAMRDAASTAAGLIRAMRGGGLRWWRRR